VADGDARAELLKLGVRKIVEEALEAEVVEATAPPPPWHHRNLRRCAN
jgi:hypothetical protein